MRARAHALRWGLAASLLVHAGALAWLLDRAPRRARVPPAPETAGLLIDLEVPLAPPPASAPPPAQGLRTPPVQPRPPAPAPARIAAPRPAAPRPAAPRPAQPPELTASPPAHPPASPAPGALAMRQPNTPAPGGPSGEPSIPAATPAPLDLAPDRAASAVVRDPGPPPPPSPLALPGRATTPRPRSELIPDGNGTFRADDLTFTAKIDRDGRVHIEDKANLQVHLPGWDDLEHALETGTVPFPRVTFDLTDWVMRSAGDDPYLRRKALFLDRTRAQRAKMSAAARAEALRESLDALPSLLARLWNDSSISPATRRRLLFELWDECAESGSDAVVQAGNTARAIILAFIRRRLPRGSEHAYPPGERRALDAARKSRQPFTPYP